MTPLESSEVMLQVVVSPMIVILMTPEVSFTLLANINSTGITYDDRHLCLSYSYSAGHMTTLEGYFQASLSFVCASTLRLEPFQPG